MILPWKKAGVVLTLLVGFFAFLYTERPLRSYFQETGFEQLHAEHLAGILIRTIALGIVLWLIHMWGLRRFNGIEKHL